MENNSTNQLKQRKIQKMGNIIQNIIWMQKKNLEKQAIYPKVKNSN